MERYFDYEYLQELMGVYGDTVYRLAKEINMSKSTILDCYKGKSEPRFSTVVKIARYYGYDVDDFVRRCHGKGKR